MRKLLCMSLLAAVFLTSSAAVAENELPIIGTKQLKSKIDHREKMTLIEALAPKAYAKGHLPGAIRMTDADESAAKLLPDKKAEIVVYCGSVH